MKPVSALLTAVENAFSLKAHLRITGQLGRSD